MRNIYFRGKRTDNNVWVFGSLISIDDGEQRIATSCLADSDKTLPLTVCAYVVDPDTVGQFTGLTGNNGEHIYEGDIVTIQNSSRPGLPGEVHWYKRSCAYAIRRIEYSSIPLDDYTEYEIVGNIYDNPELIQ